MPRGSYHKQVGLAREQQVVDALATPMTVQQLASMLGMCIASISIYVTRLHAEPKRIYVSGHERRHSGMPAAIWSAGSLPDVEFVPLQAPARKTSASERRDQVIALLAERPRTIRELGEAMHIVYRAAGKYVRELRKPDNKRIYVKKWLHPSETYPGKRAGSWAPVYATGNKPDMPAPAKETSAQRHARRYKIPAVREAEALRRKRDYLLNKARKQPQTWFTALMPKRAVAMKEVI